MPTRRNRVMRFLNTLRNKLTRRKKKPRRSRRRRKPRMSRLRRFINRNRNRLRTRKNVAKGKIQPKKISDCKPKPKPGILRAPKPMVPPLLRMALQNRQKQRKTVTFSPQASNFKPPTTTKKKPTIDDIIEALRKSKITSLKRSKSTDTNLSDLGKRRKSRKKNKRKY